MDVYFKSQGYERISLDRVTDLNALVLCQDLVQVKMRNFSPF